MRLAWEWFIDWRGPLTPVIDFAIIMLYGAALAWEWIQGNADRPLPDQGSLVRYGRVGDPHCHQVRELRRRLRDPGQAELAAPQVQSVMCRQMAHLN